MATKKGLTRVSPGVYRDAKGNLTQVTGILSEPPKAKQKKPKDPPPAQEASPPPPPPLPQYEGAGLQEPENTVINQTFQRDYQAGNQLEQMQPAAFAPFNQPFDWQAAPKAPVIEDVTSFAKQASDNYAKAFEERMAPEFKRQREDFEQDMYNRGIPVGSPRYNEQKMELERRQQDARTQAFASGQSQALANAQSLFGLGTEARRNFQQEQLTARNMPFEEYLRVSGSVSPFAAQGYGAAQNMQAQQAQQAHQRWMMKNTPRGGGGGGGGADPYLGFGSAQGLWEAQDARKLALLERELALNQQYAPKQPSSPGYAAQLGGSLLGGLATGIGLGLF